MPATPYTHYLLALATEQQTQIDATKRPPQIDDPAVFVNAILRFFLHAMSDEQQRPVTRMGMERALDALFSLPELTPVLDAPENHQNTFASAYLPQASQIFHSFWSHIICPAWNQHADVRRVCLATAAATAPATAPGAAPANATA